MTTNESMNSTASDDLFEHFKIQVDPKQSPLRIDKFLLDRVEKVSRNRIQNAIKSGSILVNEKEVKPNYKVRPGDLIKLVLPNAPTEYDLTPEKIDLDIKYEDDHILIVNKQAGLVVHPGVGNFSGTLVNGLMHYFKHELPIKAGNSIERPGLVHRIDKATSGLLVIAKTDYAMTHLAKQFFDHTVEREYLALVWGAPDPSSGTIEGHIGRDPKNRTVMKVYPEADQGKHAITHYETIEDLYYVSLIKCILETGRTHQIRAHMKHVGHPLFNDQKYGGNQIRKGTVFSKYRQFVNNCFKVMPRQSLHAHTLGFEHPETGERMHFQNELPADFEAVLNKWRSYLDSRKSL